MDNPFSHEEFTRHLNSTFEVRLDQNGAVPMELTEVSELKLYPKQEHFAIEFRGPLDKFLGQGTRTFIHNEMGQFEIFLVPVRQDEQGFYYEAIFNRVRK